MIDLVFVPGLLCTEALWSHQLEHLGDVARMSVAALRSQDSIEDMAAHVLEVAPPQFALCGLSMGGIVAHAIMRMAPERVNRLALLDTTARTETPEQTARRQTLLEMVDAGRFADVTDTLMPALIHTDRLGDTALTRTMNEMALTVGPEAFRRQLKAIIGRPPALPALKNYRCPTLLVCGREDAITPLELHTEMAAAIPGSQLAIIEQCGHITTLERPQAVTALLRLWLDYPARTT